MYVQQPSDEQTTPRPAVDFAVYGLFEDMDYEGSTLLGVYFLEGEAEAAREAYIAEELAGFSVPLRGTERPYYEQAIRVKRLATGQVPSLYFAD